MAAGTTGPARPAAGLFAQPWLLLMLPPLFWSGNFVLGRAVADAVPPVALAFWRWALGALIVLPFAWPHLRRDLEVLLAHRWIVLVLSALGIACFNTFVYIGLADTTALNAVMMQSAMPVLIVAMSFMLFREPVAPLQGLGIAVSLAGALTLIARGDPATLAGLRFNTGDLWIIAAVLAYAAYTALLRRRPAVHGLSLLAATFTLGAAMLLPVYLAESLGGRPLAVNAVSLGSIAYVAVFPSILAYLCFNRAVAVIGANRTGLSIHLMPVFGSLLAIGWLGERPHWFHGVGIALIAAGIALATRRVDHR
ncbi:DMT family transporter [Azospirillum halopraeferens]|uniref:DMT family transporter n=1 Tax=Azospirillum halopraeferens TaxID=34010 RepID=UPI00040A0042|nr:DMT family transporter [Azospirillum halopraeferens]